jgi:hypothetical protein
MTDNDKGILYNVKKKLKAAMDFSHFRSIIRNARFSNGPFRVYYKEIVLYVLYYSVTLIHESIVGNLTQNFVCFSLEF